MADAKSKLNGLVLTGGGARAAYQVGVLRAISEITKFKENPFQIITGFSAGAINGTWLASHTENFDVVTENMWDQWATIEMNKVFKTSSASMANIALQWVTDRALGPFRPNTHISHLLDTSPLFDFLNTHINFANLKANVDSGKIRGISMISANYHSGQSVAFFAGDPAIKTWEGRNKISVRTDLRAEHIMASSAIPIFFSPIRIDDAYYGDGMVRLTSPLSPAIHMGSERMLVIGIRGPSAQSTGPEKLPTGISIAEIAGTVLNGLFFDALDADTARMEKLNSTLSLVPEQQLIHEPDGLRHIPLLTLNPSEEVAVSADCALDGLPLALNYLIRGMGVGGDQGRDLLSYLAFEPKYMKMLLELGYEDTLHKKHEVLEFFNS